MALGDGVFKVNPSIIGLTVSHAYAEVGRSPYEGWTVEEANIIILQ